MLLQKVFYFSVYCTPFAVSQDQNVFKTNSGHIVIVGEQDSNKIIAESHTVSISLNYQRPRGRQQVGQDLRSSVPGQSRSSPMKSSWRRYGKILPQPTFTPRDTRRSGARLRRKGIPAGKKRYLRLMKANDLLAPTRPKSNGSSRTHDGTIRTEQPNRMWGTDGKQFWTRQNGLCWFFGVIDHCNDEILGWHASVIGNRFAALEPVHQAVSKQFGSLDKGIAHGTGLSLRRDHGTQYDSRDFQREMKFLGLEQSPAFVHSPECNGIIERFNRTLQEQVFDIHNFETIDEAREVIGTFIERLGYRSPFEFKTQLQGMSQT